LITYNIDGEINHNNLSTHNRGKSQDKRYMIKFIIMINKSLKALLSIALHGQVRILEE
jgi:hypothetical protein